MKKYLLFPVLIFILCSHDMYLKLDNYFLEPDTNATIELFNGTFEKSENVIDRDRMVDASLVGNGKRSAISTDQWTEKDSITLLNFKTGNAGTWVAGVSTAARNIAMEAADFNNYLEHDGVMDMLASRKENDVMDENAIEKYSKHVKVIFQVGDATTMDWSKPLGYPIEFIPLSNPYEKYTGDTLQFKLLRDGKPLANQLVYANYKSSGNAHTHEESDEPHTHDDSDAHHHNQSNPDDNHTHEHGAAVDDHQDQGADSHTHGDSQHPHDHNQVESKEEKVEAHTHTNGKELRTNEKGEISLKLVADGIWYLRTIHLVTSQEEGLTHESNWATLTFQVTHDHNDDDGPAHQHDDEGIPTWIFIVTSIVVVGVLFFIFRRKK